MSTQTTLTETEALQLRALIEWFDAQPAPDGEWRNTGRAQELIRAYNADPVSDCDWTVLAVEEEGEICVGEIDNHNGSHSVLPGEPARIPVYLRFRKDLVVAWHGGIWVVDHKTASDWGSGESNSHLDEGRMSFQFRGYAWAEREMKLHQLFPNTAPWPVGPDGAFVSEAHRLRMSLPILGTIGNYLVSRKPYATDYTPRNGSKARPRNEFHMECFPFADEALDEWRDEFLGMAREILECHARAATEGPDKGWRRDRTACGHWGRCEFYDYCEAVPSAREGMLASSLYRPKEREKDL